MLFYVIITTTSRDLYDICFTRHTRVCFRTSVCQRSIRHTIDRRKIFFFVIFPICEIDSGNIHLFQHKLYPVYKGTNRHDLVVTAQPQNLCYCRIPFYCRKIFCPALAVLIDVTVELDNVRKKHRVCSAVRDMECRELMPMVQSERC